MVVWEVLVGAVLVVGEVVGAVLVVGEVVGAVLVVGRLLELLVVGEVVGAVLVVVKTTTMNKPQPGINHMCNKNVMNIIKSTAWKENSAV